MPIDYSKAKIYKLTTIHDPELVYYGSTVNPLYKRKMDHKYAFKYKKVMCSSYKLFELGIDDVEITLVESIICNSKEELHKKERFYIENNNCVNKNIPTRTDIEYREQNKDILCLKKKEYYEQNKDKIKESTKIYREQNKDIINLKQKEYYEQNKDKIKECTKIYREQYKIKDKIKEYKQKYSEQNKDIINLKKKEYYEQNKDKIKEYHKQYYLSKKKITIDQ
jgi:hypothetical protein